MNCSWNRITGQRNGRKQGTEMGNYRWSSSDSLSWRNFAQGNGIYDKKGGLGQHYTGESRGQGVWRDSGWVSISEILPTSNKIRTGFILYIPFLILYAHTYISNIKTIILNTSINFLDILHKYFSRLQTDEYFALYFFSLPPFLFLLCGPRFSSKENRCENLDKLFHNSEPQFPLP